jgi:hypothetical protein
MSEPLRRLLSGTFACGFAAARSESAPADEEVSKKITLEEQVLVTTVHSNDVHQVKVKSSGCFRMITLQSALPFWPCVAKLGWSSYLR